MKKVRELSGMIASVTTIVLAAVAGAQTSITLWDFNQAGLSTTSPAPASGSGSVTLLGGVTFASSGAFASQSGSSDVNAGSAWNTSSFPAQGNGSGTAGFEFQADCSNFTGVTFEFDFRLSGTASKYYNYLYSTDHGATWTSFLTAPFAFATPSTTSFINNFGDGNFPGDPILALPAAADHNSDVRVRIVSVFDPSTGSYTPNSSANYGTTGTMRLDMVEFKGMATTSLPPQVAGTPLTPAGVCAGDTTTPILLQVNVTAGQNPPSSTLTVTADLTSVLGAGHSADALIDFGGGAFGLSFNAASTTTPGFKSIPIHVVDDQNRTADTTLSLGMGDCSANADSDIVIAQIYGGGGTASAPIKQDYIVLYNRSCNPVDISNWSLQYGNTNSGSGLTIKLDLVPVAANYIVPAKSYFLVQAGVAGVNDLGADLSTIKTPDFIPTGNPGSGISMSQTTGRIAIVRDTVLIGTNFTSPTIADFVGYGSTAATYEGAAPTTNLDAADALFRKDAGNQDSNQNFNDFDYFAPAPVNSADPMGGTCTTTCPADLDNGSGLGSPDGGVDINDLLFFLSKFELGDVAADLDDGSGTGHHDGGVDINDLLFFLIHFEAGC